MARSSFVYILASQRNGTLYIGITASLRHRVYQHKQGQADGFTRKYGVNQLVYYEEYTEIGLAIQREKQLKKWNRGWKLALIEEFNADWVDLYWEVCG